MGNRSTTIAELIELCLHYGKRQHWGSNPSNSRLHPPPECPLSVILGCFLLWPLLLQLQRHSRCQKPKNPLDLNFWKKYRTFVFPCYSHAKLITPDYSELKTCSFYRIYLNYFGRTMRQILRWITFGRSLPRLAIVITARTWCDSRQVYHFVYGLVPRFI